MKYLFVFHTCTVYNIGLGKEPAQHVTYAHTHTHARTRTHTHTLGVTSARAKFKYFINRYHIITVCVFLQILKHTVVTKQGDFCNAPFESETFDKVYAIEASCHAADLSKVYREAFRVLKPGGLFASYEWVMTDKYDPTDPYHRRLKEEIMVGVVWMFIN